MEDENLKDKIAIPAEPVAEEELGVLPVGLSVGNPFGTYDEEEELNIADVSIEELDAMVRKDGTARSLYNILTLPIRGANWSITAADDGEDEAAFIRAMLTLPPHRGGMSTPMDYIISVAAKAIRQGFVLWEKVYRIGDIEYTDSEGNVIKKSNAILLKKLAHRPSDQITFKTDAHGGLNGAVQRVYYKGRLVEAVLPKEKILVYTVNKHENSLYGESLLLPAYYHYDKKHKLYYTAHLAYMMNAIPPRIGEYPMTASKSAQTAFKTALANLGLNSTITYPKSGSKDTPQYNVKTFESSRALADFVPLIEHHNSEMSKSVLAQFIELSSRGTGSRALSEDQSEFLLMALEAIMDEIAYTINAYLIPEFIDWNFGTGRYPEFSFEPLVDSTRELLKATFTTLANASSSQVTPEFMLELEKRIAEEFRFEIDYNEIEQQMQADQEARREQMKNASMFFQRPPGEPQGQGEPQEREQEPPQLGGGLNDFLTELRDEIEAFESILADREADPTVGD